MASPNVLRAINPRHNPTQDTLNRLLRPFEAAADACAARVVERTACRLKLRATKQHSRRINPVIAR